MINHFREFSIMAIKIAILYLIFNTTGHPLITFSMLLMFGPDHLKTNGNISRVSDLTFNVKSS